MTIAIVAPLGGITAELGGLTRPLVLRNGEIERFEERHSPLGLFDVLNRFIKGDPFPQVLHCRDVVTLGLIGGGMPDDKADGIISGIGPSGNVMIRAVARDLVLAAFNPAPDEKKSPPPADGDDVTP